MTNPSARLAPKIEATIHALLSALIERPAPEQRADHVVTANEGEDDDALDEADLDAIIADPIGSALRSEIAALGGFLFDVLGGPDDLEAVAERIAAMDATNHARRAAILDECWSEVEFEDEDEEGR